MVPSYARQVFALAADIKAGRWSRFYRMTGLPDDGCGPRPGLRGITAHIIYGSSRSFGGRPGPCGAHHGREVLEAESSPGREVSRFAKKCA